MAPQKLLDDWTLLTAVDLRAIGLAWGRALPTVTLVPAFGLSAVPAPTRAVMGLAIAMLIAPALPSHLSSTLPWTLAFGLEFAKGLPVAVGAAGALWAATQLGAVVDAVRGNQINIQLPIQEDGAGPLSPLFGMLAALFFLESGGATRTVKALLALEPLSASLAWIVVRRLLASVEIAFAVAAPVVALVLVVEVTSSLVARAATPAYLQSVVAPLKSLAILAVLALLLDRMLSLLNVWAGHGP